MGQKNDPSLGTFGVKSSAVTEGVFDTVIQGIKNFLTLGVNVMLSHVIIKWNVEDLVEVCKTLWAPDSPLFALDRVPPIPFNDGLLAGGAFTGVRERDLIGARCAANAAFGLRGRSLRAPEPSSKHKLPTPPRPRARLLPSPPRPPPSDRAP